MKGNFKVGVGVAVLFAALMVAVLPSLGSGLTPDSAEYLELSPFRQPLYGLWANGLYLVSGSWRAVQIIQICLYIAISAWIIIELSTVSYLGLLAALAFAAVQLVLAKLGVCGLAGNLISEGLFFPLVLFQAALLLAWLRTKSIVPVIALIVVLVAMTQTRSAALLVVAAPLLIAFIAILKPVCSSMRKSAAIALLTLVLACIFMPWMLGKRPLQMNTAADTTGFVLLPRVGLLPPSHAITATGGQWLKMADSWREQASKLSLGALTQYDEYLQEAIRYELGPKLLIPILTHRTPTEAERDWGSGTAYSDARNIAIEWIMEQWPSYLKLSATHFWGMLTMANYIDDIDRKSVWAALNKVSPETWLYAKLRKDHPLNRIDEPLKPTTNYLYMLFRYGSILLLCIGIFEGIRSLTSVSRSTLPSAGAFAIACAMLWAVTHSIPAALVYAPEWRYTFANFLVMLCGGAIWIAYLGFTRDAGARNATR